MNKENLEHMINVKYYYRIFLESECPTKYKLCEINNLFIGYKYKASTNKNAPLES